MTEHRYILQKGGRKHICPECNKKTFVLFIDTHTGEVLPDEYGRCDREVNCTYFLDPYKSGYAKMVSDKEKGENVNGWKPYKPALAPKAPPLPPSFIDLEIFKKSRSDYDNNNFVSFLLQKFGEDVTTKAISTYHIGTSKYQFTHKDYPDFKSETGATVFWQIDKNGKIRSGKLILYSSETGKRVKQPFNHVHWAHKAIKAKDFNLVQCLFGEHLLIKDPDKPIAVVESEKTAIIASVYLPMFNWVAVGALTNLKPDTCQALKGKKVFLFPDLKCFERWNTRAEELRISLPGTTIVVSDILESNSTAEEKAEGLDIADYLLRYDWQGFDTMSGLNFFEDSSKTTISVQPDNQALNPEVKCNAGENGISESQIVIKPGIPGFMEQEDILQDPPENEKAIKQFNISEYKAWVKTVEMPAGHIKLNQQVDIYDMCAFITGRLNHISAFTNYRDQGKRPLYIRQLQYIQRHFKTLLNQPRAYANH